MIQIKQNKRTRSNIHRSWISSFSVPGHLSKQSFAQPQLLRHLGAERRVLTSVSAQIKLRQTTTRNYDSLIQIYIKETNSTLIFEPGKRFAGAHFLHKPRRD